MCQMQFKKRSENLGGGKYDSDEGPQGINNVISTSLWWKLQYFDNFTFVQAPKDYDILAVPLTNTAVKMLKMRKGTPEEWRQYLSKPYALP